MAVEASSNGFLFSGGHSGNTFMGCHSKSVDGLGDARDSSKRLFTFPNEEALCTPATQSTCHDSCSGVERLPHLFFPPTFVAGISEFVRNQIHFLN